MAAYEEKTGGEVLAIAHNGNLSNGRMFPIIESFTGKPIDREYAETRAKWERALRGDADQGRRRDASVPLAQRRVRQLRALGQGQPGPQRAEEARDAGVRVRALGAQERPQAGSRNSASIPTSSAWSAPPTRTPASPRSRRTTSSARPRASEPSATRATHPFMKTASSAQIMGWEQTASGYAAVWATENTREAHLRRHEAQGDLRHHRPAHGRALLRRLGLRGQGRAATACRPRSATPRACRWAATSRRRPQARRRPSSSPRSRTRSARISTAIQIIKGWLDAKGEMHEKVYDVAWSGDRKPGADGKLPPVGNTVDVPNATWTNTIGAPELIAVWKDPDFDPAQRAFYYGRVIEIPTPRWTAYDAKYFGVKMPQGGPHDHAPSAPTRRRSGTRRRSKPERPHETNPARAAAAFPPAGGRDLRGLRARVQARQRRAGKDRRHARGRSQSMAAASPAPGSGRPPARSWRD